MFFLRIMAVVSVAKGLYHWAQVTGFVGGEEEAFENQPMAWQAATVYFAVIELVAAVGLWLATPWGAVVWLTTVVSMAVIELMFPGIYGGSLYVVAFEAVMLTALSRAGMDGRARTAAIVIVKENIGPHPEERALARVSKDGRESIRCCHPSRRIAFAMLLRMRSARGSIKFSKNFLQ